MAHCPDFLIVQNYDSILVDGVADKGATVYVSIRSVTCGLVCEYAFRRR